MLRRWRKNVLRGLCTYLRQQHGRNWTEGRLACHPDIVVGRSCNRHTAGADWWEWRTGSTLYFWRWPDYAITMARDGHPVWVRGNLPSYTCPQRREADSELRHKVCRKLQNVRSKGYIGPSGIKSLTSYFAVPKGSDDIRMVYDATKSGLNKALWVPSFSLPSCESLTDLLDNNSWMADQDMGEMFLNFPLCPKIRPYCGVDLRPYLDPGNTRGTTWWEGWNRCMMGLMSSPYICTKMIHLVNEAAKGDRLNPENPLRWARVELNLPGSPAYTPTLPWVYRVKEDGTLAGDAPTYVDDMRPTGSSEEECWQVGHYIGCQYSYRGIQVTARKSRPPSRDPGAWTGILASTGPEGVAVRCSQEKWDKGKAFIEDIMHELQMNQTLRYKPLEQKRGFFVHLTRTYPGLTPFLKGMHLT
jgi:hypothetical protein